MTSTIAEPEILKTDGLGRVRTPAAQREALLDAFERSGLSGMKFAALHGVKYPSFANWVQRGCSGANGIGCKATPDPSVPREHPLTWILPRPDPRARFIGWRRWWPAGLPERCRAPVPCGCSERCPGLIVKYCS